MFLMNGYTLREAAEALGVSMVTVRRYIKSGKLKARLVSSKFGESYIIDDLPLLNKPLSDNTISTQPLINRIEQLSQEVGYFSRNDYCFWNLLSRPLSKNGGKGYSGLGSE